MTRRILAICLFLITLAAVDAGAQEEVVVYTALDRIFSEPILKEFETRTGIRVRAKYDTESTKTIGLVNTIRAEKRRPRCDVFWNNEIVNTIRLKNEGLLVAYRPRAAAAFPAAFRDPDGCWTGFAARARVLLVNTDLVPEAQRPTSIFDMTAPKWKGRIGIAKPLFGTTATHAACLFSHLGDAKAAAFFADLRRNDVRIEGGNKQVALSVAAGRLAFGLTDTDDAIIEVEAGKPVTIVYPDAAEAQQGVLFIPNTLSLIKGGPNPDAGRKLIESLLSPQVEAALARAASAQIPVNPKVTEGVRVKTPADVKPMALDFNAAAARFEAAAAHIKKHFLH
jgi:iron(III) transport system substrate-binding protein